jgi:hypothetical protein
MVLENIVAHWEVLQLFQKKLLELLQVLLLKKTKTNKEKIL